MLSDLQLLVVSDVDVVVVASLSLLFCIMDALQFMSISAAAEEGFHLLAAGGVYFGEEDSDWLVVVLFNFCALLCLARFFAYTLGSKMTSLEQYA